MARHYHNRRDRGFSRRHGRLELILTIAVVALVLAVLVVFLVVYHDLPLRVSGGSR